MFCKISMALACLLALSLGAFADEKDDEIARLRAEVVQKNEQIVKLEKELRDKEAVLKETTDLLVENTGALVATTKQLEVSTGEKVEATQLLGVARDRLGHAERRFQQEAEDKIQDGLVLTAVRGDQATMAQNLDAAHKELAKMKVAYNQVVNNLNGALQQLGYAQGAINQANERINNFATWGMIPFVALFL